LSHIGKSASDRSTFALEPISEALSHILDLVDRRIVWIALLFLSCGGRSTEARLRSELAATTTGVIRLPAGLVEVSSELRLAPDAHDLEIVGSGTVLKASDRFAGRAILVAEGVQHVHLRDFSVDGNRAVLEKPQPIIPPENAFRVYYSNNGIWFDRVDGLEISNVHFKNVTNFPILISRSSAARIVHDEVRDSGSLNAAGKNNATGGILIEEGSSDFEVRDCVFVNILGNAVWTHSLLRAPRSRNGTIAENHFEFIGRDAIQVGHATNVRVELNTGTHIGYPVDIVDARERRWRWIPRETWTIRFI